MKNSLQKLLSFAGTLILALGFYGAIYPSTADPPN